MNTIESWDNFTRYYGGIVGARDCFELVCEDLLKRENPTCEVHRIKASRGDGGIDIHVSNGKLVQIYQCKFFVDVLNASRWQQIDNSFLKVLEQQEININEWFLCVPKEFTKEEIIEIENFKNKYSTKGIKITFIDGNELISRMKEVSICEKWFSPVPQRCLCINEPKICPEYIDRIEVETLKEYILSRKHHLLISGIGGMGKTTLAEKLFNEVKMMFDVSLWMTYKGSGGPWAIIEGIEPIFVAVGSSLVVLFFVIGFCSESVDVKDEMRFESILRMFIRLGLAEWFVANNVTIMKAFFTSIGNLVNLMSAGTTVTLSIDSTQADVIKNLGFGESLVMLILAALLSIIVIICGFFIIYTVYFRFLKILIIVPLGAIAFSTMGGNRMVSHTAVTYCKYFLSVVMEAVTMALAIIVCNAFISAGLPSFTGSYADWAKTLIYLCEMTFTIAMTVGSVKGAQSLTSKALGL